MFCLLYTYFDYHHGARIPQYWKEFLTFCRMFNASLSIAKKRAERKLLPFLTLFPISFVFPLFYCVEKQSFKSGLCISLFCTFCVLNVMTNKSRDEPTSLSIASTISLLPPSFSTTGILCFKNTGELDHESCFSSFFWLWKLLFTTLHYSRNWQNLFTRRVRQKTAVSKTMQHFTEYFSFSSSLLCK